MKIPFAIKTHHGWIESRNDILFIHVAGYTNAGSVDKEAAVVALEVYEGRLRALLWTDKDSEEPEVVELQRAAIRGKTCTRCNGNGDAVCGRVELDEHCADCGGTGVVVKG